MYNPRQWNDSDDLVSSTILPSVLCRIRDITAVVYSVSSAVKLMNMETNVHYLDVAILSVH